MRGGYTTSEMVAHRNRCRVAHIAVDDASLLQYTVSAALPARFTEYLAIYGPITIAIRARFEYDSTTIRLQHATTRYEVFRALAYEIVYENQW